MYCIMGPTPNARNNHIGKMKVFDNAEKKKEKKNNKKEESYGAPIDHRSKRW